jgi:hypothetical protein
MSLDLVTSVLGWSQQSRDFRADGTVRDIFIANTTLEDWRAVLDVIFRPEHRAALMARGAVEDLPREPPIYRYSTDPPNLEWIPPLRPHRDD